MEAFVLQYLLHFQKYESRMYILNFSEDYKKYFLICFISRKIISLHLFLLIYLI